MQTHNCRLFVIFAQAADVAVILRRGPTGWYHVVRWDTKRDEFLQGAWLRGRIYEGLCDISPDGELLLYFVYKHIRRPSTHCYTALSRVPWLHALVIWPNPGWPISYGGRFVGKRLIAPRGTLAKPYPVLPKGIHLGRGDAPPHASTDEVEGADWTGHDQRGRLCYTVGGTLYRMANDQPQLLADFTDLRPNPQPPPEAAKRPL